MYNVSNVDDCWEMDLCDMQALKTYNDNFAYLLVVIDILSKYAWVEPLYDKSVKSVVSAFDKILKRANGRSPALVQTNKVARNPDVKAAVVERLNRTLNERMFSGIKMIPAKVNMRNADEARKNLQKRALSQRKQSRVGIYRVGEHVRISRTKGTFDKGYEKNYSEEIFRVHKVSRRQNLYTY
ncbi:uncharacterized protein LOC116417812 [Nasonia vitripennis]|uniref:Integrase catalytic domain-containing protein n=1 Tax=Nasonia vitripennis TaxID=7425 RepID=A0A7M7QJS5_NASVI|nr:uncharacterized protein LOC116417812 [Nasonia vitripennis]